MVRQPGLGISRSRQGLADRAGRRSRDLGVLIASSGETVFQQSRPWRTLGAVFSLGLAIPVFYLPAFFYNSATNFAIVDHWRFWIVHLWVEDFFELFVTVVVAVLFYRLGAVNVNSAKRVIYLDAILYLMGGILGTAHHWYFTGQSSMTMAIGASFSALEVVPLVLLTLDAWDFIRVSEGDIDSGGKRTAISYQWTFYFLMAVGFWNFLGAGVFGFLINMPIVSYFEVGTILTPQPRTRVIHGRIRSARRRDAGLCVPRSRR
ncbi:MAG TPA: cbb3-type cytochrome c oxidase subunit I [Candidatus Binataceae bacterium]